MEWLDLFIVWVFGLFGVHKYKEGDIAMAIAYPFTAGLFLCGWIRDIVIYYQAASRGERIGYGGVVIKDIQEDEPLPILNDSNVKLSKGEVCHYCEPAKYAINETALKEYHNSFRIMKAGGKLTITNKRIIYTGSQGSFDKKFEDLSSINPGKDYIGFQFNCEYILLLTYGVPYASKIISRIMNQTDDDVEIKDESESKDIYPEDYQESKI